MTLLVALIGIVPAVVTSGLSWMQSGRTAVSQRETTERSAEAGWIRAALAIPGDEERHEALRFLVDAGLVRHDAKLLQDAADRAPQFPATTGTPMVAPPAMGGQMPAGSTPQKQP